MFGGRDGGGAGGIEAWSAAVGVDNEPCAEAGVMDSELAVLLAGTELSRIGHLGAVLTVKDMICDGLAAVEFTKRGGVVHEKNT